MKLYLLTVVEPEGTPPPPEVLQEIGRKIEVIHAEIRAAGAWVFAGALHHPSSATLVKTKDGEAILTDGPFAEGKEHVGGFSIIRAPDLDAALVWAKKLSAATTLPIEVRSFRDVIEDPKVERHKPHAG